MKVGSGLAARNVHSTFKPQRKIINHPLLAYISEGERFPALLDGKPQDCRFYDITCADFIRKNGCSFVVCFLSIVGSVWLILC
jgi:hypothetical protein